MGSSSFIPGMAMCFVLKFVQMHDPWMQSLAAHEVQDAQSWHLSQWLVLLSFSHRHCIYDTKSEEAIHTPATRLEALLSVFTCQSILSVCTIFLFFPFPFCFWSASSRLSSFSFWLCYSFCVLLNEELANGERLRELLGIARVWLV